MQSQFQSTKISADFRQKAIHTVTLYGMVMDLTLSVAKILSGVVVNSTALIADGLHSLSDMLTDILVLIVNKLAHEDPDEDHPYGHARFETVGTLLLGVVLLSVGATMGLEYGGQLLNNEISTHPSKWALLIVFISLIGKEWQFRFTMKVAKKVRSSLLEANAWHSRTDSFSSFIVLIGISATLLGYPQIEIISALFVAYLIARMGSKMSWGALQELMDKGLTNEQQKVLLDSLKNTQGIVSVHQLRTRKMSNQILLDAHIQVASRISVSEGHQINEYAMSKLREIEPELQDITLHIDHEADDLVCEWKLAPLRHEIEDYLLKFNSLKNYSSITVHYHNQNVCLELLFTQEINEMVRVECQQAIDESNWLKEIKLIQLDAIYYKNTEVP